MNIFILDADIEKCAEYHCDQHVVKMILESVQILCTALYKHGFSTPYKPTHQKHPCVLWAEDSYDNFIWLKKLALALNEEYKYRFERSNDHKSIAVFNEISGFRYKKRGLSEFAQAMPQRYRVEGNPVMAYRKFYIGEKIHFARWTKRGMPYWVKEVSNIYDDK
jgi:hypothetical protein